MTLKQFQDRIKGHYEITRTTIATSYYFRLGSNGNVILQYHNDKITNIIVQGKDAEKIKKILGITVDNDKK